MTGLLRGAFTRACEAVEYAGDLYDKAGLFVWRVFTDKTLFDIDSESIQSPVLRKAAEFYDWGLDKTQGALFNKLYQTSTMGDYAPRPDIKPGLMRVAQAGMAVLPRLGQSQSLAAMAFLAAAVATTYAINQTGNTTMISDAAGVWASMSGQNRFNAR